MHCGRGSRKADLKGKPRVAELSHRQGDNPGKSKARPEKVEQAGQGRGQEGNYSEAVFRAAFLEAWEAEDAHLATLPLPTSLDSAIKCVLQAAAPGAADQLQAEDSHLQPAPGQPLPHRWIG